MRFYKAFLAYQRDLLYNVYNDCSKLQWVFIQQIQIFVKFPTMLKYIKNI